MKRIHRSLLLAGLFLAFGGGSFLYAYVTDIRHRPNKRLEDQEERRLFHFGRDHVQKGRIFARGATIAFARDPDYGWRLTSPVETPADATAIDAALDHMAIIRGDPVETGAVTPEVLRRYELDRPRMWMEVDTKQGPLTLLVGPKNMLDDRYFVTDAARNRVVLADGAFYGALDRNLDAFRDRRIFPFPSAQVQRVRVFDKEKLRFDLFKDAAGLRVTDGASEPIPADEGEASLLFVALTNRLRADRYLTDELVSEDPAALAEIGFKQGDVAIEVESKSGKRMRAILGFFRETSAERVSTVIHVEGGKTVAIVPDAVRKDIEKGLAELRDRTISRFDADQVKQIELVRGDGSSIVIERSDARADTWTVGQKKKPALTWKVQPILNLGSHLKVARIVKAGAGASDVAQMSLDPPGLRVRMLDARGSVLSDVDIGKDLPDGQVAIRKHGAFEIGVVPKKLLEIFPASEDDVLEPSASAGTGADRPNADATTGR